MRANARPALQTGAAILALALALEVSAAPHAAFFGHFDVSDGPHVDFDAYAPASWSLSASASDGWFV